MVTILTGSFIFFAKHTEPLRALEDVIPRPSGDVRKYKVLDFRYSGTNGVAMLGGGLEDTKGKKRHRKKKTTRDRLKY